MQEDASNFVIHLDTHAETAHSALESVGRSEATSDTFNQALANLPDQIGRTTEEIKLIADILQQIDSQDKAGQFMSILLKKFTALPKEAELDADAIHYNEKTAIKLLEATLLNQFFKGELKLETSQWKMILDGQKDRLGKIDMQDRLKNEPLSVAYETIGTPEAALQFLMANFDHLKKVYKCSGEAELFAAMVYKLEEQAKTNEVSKNFAMWNTLIDQLSHPLATLMASRNPFAEQPKS